MSTGINLNTKFVSEITGEFHVPSYQRGYRWGEKEVKRLLEDIFSFGENCYSNDRNANYYLQPIVVRKKGDIYELIDGQQRFTTIYLIYKYMHEALPILNGPQYNLTYQTRSESSAFLKNLDLSQKDKNIDFWYIANAYETIKKWFEEKPPYIILKISEYFEKCVKIIWYEVDEGEDAISLFTRLNIGKIPLTNAELVKAMFLISYKSGQSKKTADEFSLQWDSMEKELHNDKLWYFLTNNKNGKDYQTRIDLVLDLISGKTEDERDIYFSFFKIDEMKEGTSLDEVWNKILRTFLLLKDWFENHELYHKIGYLIASESTALDEIFRLSENKTKSEFRIALDEAITKSIALKNENYANLSYEKRNEYEKISKLLFLFNVESVRLHGKNTEWFPFDEYKGGKGNTVTWSLEHIRAQQSEGLKTLEMWKEWLNLHIASVKANSQDQELIDKLSRFDKKQVNPEDYKKINISRGEFEDLQKEVLRVLQKEDNVDSMHTIGNLALLNTRDNAALNNSTFDVKRNLIIEMDKAGQYIPFCTRMVFLKYYSESQNNQLHFWGETDRISYINEINRVLASPIPDPNNPGRIIRDVVYLNEPIDA